MTISQLIEWASQNQFAVVTYMIVVPLLSLLVTRIFGSAHRNASSRFIYSVLIYATCVPGVLAIILCSYTIGLRRLDMLKLNVIVYFIPIISMAISLKIIGSKTRMSNIPGFKRLSGFMLMIGVTFIIVFILQRLFIGVLFFGTLQSLMVLFVALYIAIKIAWDKLTE